MSLDALRRAATQDYGRRVFVETLDGLKFEIREPTVGAKAQFVDALKPAMKKKLGGDDSEALPEDMDAEDIARASMLLTVRCVFDPESGRRVWNDDEVDVLLGTRTLGDLLSAEVQKLMGSSKGDAGKESEETPSSADDSSSEKPSDSP